MGRWGDGKLGRQYNQSRVKTNMVAEGRGRWEMGGVAGRMDDNNKDLCTFQCLSKLSLFDEAFGSIVGILQRLLCDPLLAV